MREAEFDIHQFFVDNEYSEIEQEFGLFLNSIDEQVSEFLIQIGIKVLRAFLAGNLCLILDDLDVEKIKNTSSLLIGSPGEKRIFILEHSRLYFQKYWKREEDIVDFIKAKSLSLEEINPSDQIIDSSDGQKVAVVLSRLKHLVFITGGPGTGKTYTIQEIVRSELEHSEDDLIIYVAAPTGKAAQRLNEALGSSPDFDKEIKAITVHSLLGAREGDQHFRINKDNQLKADVVIVDEASMLDVSLWTALIRGVNENTKLILVGDPNQLSSVEAGSIFGDICSRSNMLFSSKVSASLHLNSKNYFEHDVNDSIVHLTKNYRFEDSSGLQELSDAIKKSDSEKVMYLFESHNYPKLQWQETTNQSIDNLISTYSVQPYLKLVEGVLNQDILKGYQILTAIKKGPFGSLYINDVSERKIKEYLDVSVNKLWFHGRSVIATKNDYRFKIWNGEIGVYDEQLDSVIFENNPLYPEGINKIKLTNFEPSQALTIHKSQGSEFKNVAILLPNEENALLTKELLYTAVTRARESILVVGNRNILINSIGQSMIRNSGLVNKIWD